MKHHVIDLSHDMVVVDPCSPIAMKQPGPLAEIDCVGGGSWWPWLPIVIALLILACVLCIVATHEWLRRRA